MAFARAGAASLGIPLYQHIANLSGNKNLSLPVPSFNVINGGSHAGNKIAIQEFMIMPTGASSFTEAMQMGCEVYQILKKLIKQKYGQDGFVFVLFQAINVGDEGGFAPNIESTTDCLDLLTEAIKTAGYEGKIKIALDVAASGKFILSDVEFFENGHYNLHWKTPNSKEALKSGGDMFKFYSDLISKYPSNYVCLF